MRALLVAATACCAALAAVSAAAGRGVRDDLQAVGHAEVPPDGDAEAARLVLVRRALPGRVDALPDPVHLGPRLLALPRPRLRPALAAAAAAGDRRSARGGCADA